MAINDPSNSPKSIMASLKDIAATAKTKDLESKEQLYLEISEISEFGYCAGWTINIEFFLWRAILSGSEAEFGARTITKLKLKYLKTLAEQSGGWWCWSDEENEALFITLDKWQEIYQQFLKNNRVNRS